MHLNFGPRGVIQIDGAQICYRNFEGRKDQYNPAGKRTFSVIINDEEIKDALVNDLNEYGVGWNVKIKPPRDENDDVFMHLKVNVKFNGRGPKVYLVAGDDAKPVELDEEGVKCLDDMDIDYVDLDIRPYDDIIRGEAFRAAYLQEIWVHQKVSRFAARYAAMRAEDKLDF